MIQWWESKFKQINIVGLRFEQLINTPATYLPTVKEGCVTGCFNVCDPQGIYYIFPQMSLSSWKKQEENR